MKTYCNFCKKEIEIEPKPTKKKGLYSARCPECQTPMLSNGDVVWSTHPTRKDEDDLLQVTSVRFSKREMDAIKAAGGIRECALRGLCCNTAAV
jgi:NAD-dependent SIR2 family protein deacetylase